MLSLGARELGLEIEAPELERFSWYLDLLQRWGRKTNLTSRLDTREVVVYHFLDSLSGYHWVRETPGGRVVDVGTGAGFPALPLKICLPGLYVTLIESTRKKVDFCREVARRLDIRGLEILWGRGEEWGALAGYAGSYDWVLSRAVSKAASVARRCLPLLRPGGCILMYKGGSLAEKELGDLEVAVQRLGATYSIQPARVPYLDARRTHLLVRKCST